MEPQLNLSRNSYFQTIAERLHSDELTYVQRMYWLVKDAHYKQFRRISGERYFEHVRRVSWAAGITYNYCDGQTLALGLGHDLIEDTYVPQSVIVNLFGQEMYSNILVLSKQIPAFNPITGRLIARAKLDNDTYYKGIQYSNNRVKLIKGCDRLDNLRDLEQFEVERRKKYLDETECYVLKSLVDADPRVVWDVREKLRSGLLIDWKCDLCGHGANECTGHYGEGFG